MALPAGLIQTFLLDCDNPPFSLLAKLCDEFFRRESNGKLGDITGTNRLSDYLFTLLYSIKQEFKLKFFLGRGLKHLQKPLLKNCPIYIPNEIELRALIALLCLIIRLYRLINAKIEL